MKNIVPLRSITCWVFLIALCLHGDRGYSAPDEPIEPVVQQQELAPETKVESRDARLDNSSEVQRSIGEQQDLIRKLESAIEAFEAEDFANGFRLVQSLLELETDLLLPQDRFPAYGDVSPLSLKNVALRLLENLPPQAKRIYDLQQGTAADALYRDYHQESDPSRKMAMLKQLVRLYLSTENGREAAIQLGNIYFDRSQFATAIQYYERALSRSAQASAQTLFRLAWAYHAAGDESRAGQLLDRLKTMDPEERITFGGTNISVAQLTAEIFRQIPQTTTGIVDEIEEWSHSRGNRAHNVVTAAAPVGSPSWKVDMLASAFAARPDELPTARRTIRSVINATSSQEQELISIIEPVKIGRLLIVHTPSGIEARDCETGDLAWRHVQTDFEFEQQIIEQSQPGSTVVANNRTILENVLRSKLWTNTRGQSISSNGKQVFALEQLEPEAEPTGMMMAFGRNQQAQRFNRLFALEASTGKIQWEIGGTRQFQILPMAGYFFVGAPLCVEDRLYSLAISGSELLLLTIDASTGRLQRQQPLQELTQLEAQELVYNNYELTPALLDQLLICPTGNGFLKAYDLAEQRWIWSVKYPSFSTRMLILPNNDDPFDNAGGLLPSEMNHPGGEALPIVGNAHVVLAPSDSSQYFCVNGATGQQNWTRPRKDFVTVIGIDQQKLYVLNRTSIESIGLTSGETVWKSKLHGVPSGRPLLAAGLIHVPLSNGLILSLETKKGRMRSQYTLPPEQSRGVLIASEGRMYCLSEEYLTSFPSRETAAGQIELALKKVSEKPTAEDEGDDEQISATKQAWYHKAHALLLAGNTDAGLAELRELNSQYESPSARRLLIQLLSDRVRYEPDDAEPAIEELLSLITSANDSFTVLKLIVDRYVDRKEYLLAFESALSFLEKNDPKSLPLIKLEKTSIKPTLWFRAQIAGWYPLLNDAERDLVRDRVEQRMAEIDDNLQQLSELELAFRDTPLVVPLQKQLVQQINWLIEETRDQGKPADRDRDLARFQFQRNFYLRELTATDPDEPERWAYAYLQNLKERSERQLALNWLGEIERRFGKEPFHGELTGTEFARREREDLENNDSLREAFFDVEQYRVEQYPSDTSDRRLTHIELMHLKAEPGPFTSLQFMWNLSQQRMEVQTRFGQSKWSIPFPARSSRGRQSNQRQIYTSGPFLLVILDGELSVWKSRGPKEVPVMLWRRSLRETEEEVTSSNLRSRSPWYGVADIFAGPIIEDRLYYLSGSTLYAADVNTGQILWTVKQVKVNQSDDFAQLFGAGGVLGMCSGSLRQPTLTAFSSLTGELINTLPARPGAQPVALLSNQCVFSGFQNGNQEVYSQAIETGEVTWKHSFPPDATVAVEQDDTGDRMAVLEPGGNLAMIDLATGEKFVELQIDPVEKLRAIKLVPTEDQYVVLVEKEHEEQAAGRRYQNLESSREHFLTNAGCFAIDRAEGSLAWQQWFNEPLFYQSQIPELPFLVFTVSSRETRLTFRSAQLLKTCVLDRRDGKILFQFETLAGLDDFEIKLSEEKQRAEFVFRDFTIRAVPESSKPEAPEKEADDGKADAKAAPPENDPRD